KRLHEQPLPAFAENAAAIVVPTITVLTPAAAASSIVMSGMPRSALQPGRRSCPSEISGRQNAMPAAVLAASWSGASPINKRYGVRRLTVSTPSCAPDLREERRGGKAPRLGP